MRDIDRRTFLRASGLGLAGSLVPLAGCTGSGGDGSGGDGSEDTPTPASGSDGAEPAVEVTVGPGGDLVFEPETVEVEVDATVVWRWDSDGHTVTPTDIPDGSSWEGTGEETHDAGFTTRHTFATGGRYDYVCVPHESAGMVGSVLVGDVARESPTPTTTGGGGGYYTVGRML